jgi:hypothetical protein
MNQRDPELERVKRISKLLDTYMLDPILGFFLPGVGDLIGTFLGLYAVSLAAKRKMSPVIIARMLMNLAIDGAIGAIPLLGDAADVVYQANKKNVALLETRAEDGGKASWKDWAMVGGAALLLVATVTFSVYAFFSLARWVFGSPGA